MVNSQGIKRGITVCIVGLWAVGSLALAGPILPGAAVLDPKATLDNWHSQIVFCDPCQARSRCAAHPTMRLPDKRTWLELVTTGGLLQRLTLGPEAALAAKSESAWFGLKRFHFDPFELGVLPKQVYANRDSLHATAISRWASVDPQPGRPFPLHW